MPTAFVAGATGYTGRALVRVLVQKKVRVVAHLRSDSRDVTGRTSALVADGAEVDTTPWDEEAMTRALRALEPTFVFALLGTTRARARAARRSDHAPESYDSVDYALTALLLRATARCKGRPKFVYLSALGAGAPSSNAYYAARYKAESELRASGLPYVIARPAMVTGDDRPESRTGERVAAKVADGALGVLRHFGAARLSDRFGSMTADTLAAALAVLAEDPAETATVADPERLRKAAHSVEGSPAAT